MHKKKEEKKHISSFQVRQSKHTYPFISQWTQWLNLENDKK